MPCRRSVHLGDHAERALGADEQPGQVVAGRRLARPAAGADRRGRRPAPRSGRARSRAWCRSAPRWCPRPGSRPCRRGVASAPGSIGKNRPVSRRWSLSCLRVTPASTRQSRSSALTSRIRFIAARSMETPPSSGVDVALERGAGAVGDHRQMVGAADLDDPADLVGRAGEGDRVGRGARMMGLVLAVALADRQRRWSIDHRAGRAALSSAEVSALEARAVTVTMAGLPTFWALVAGAP